LLRTGDFFEDFARRFGSDEGLWVGKKRQKQIEQPATRASQIKVPSFATGTCTAEHDRNRSCHPNAATIPSGRNPTSMPDTCCSSAAKDSRNLTDQQLNAIRETGGIIEHMLEQPRGRRAAKQAEDIPASHGAARNRHNAGHQARPL
jgi:hypothetical protein